MKSIVTSGTIQTLGVTFYGPLQTGNSCDFFIIIILLKTVYRYSYFPEVMLLLLFSRLLMSLFRPPTIFRLYGDDDDHYRTNYKKADEAVMSCAGKSMHLIVSHKWR